MNKTDIRDSEVRQMVLDTIEPIEIGHTRERVVSDLQAFYGITPQEADAIYQLALDIDKRSR